MIAALDKAGYDVVMPYQVLNAADYGVPQSRQRLFLMGARKGLTNRHTRRRSSKAPRFGMPSAICPMPTGSRSSARRMPCMSNGKPNRPTPDGCAVSSEIPRTSGTRGSTISGCSHPACGRNTTELSQSRFTETVPGKTEPVSRFRKLAPEGLCNTLRAGTDSARGAFTRRGRSTPTCLASSRYAKRLGCTRIPTGSACTPPSGTASGRSATACRRYWAAQSPAASCKRSARNRRNLGRSWSSTTPSSSTWIWARQRDTSACRTTPSPSARAKRQVHRRRW